MAEYEYLDMQDTQVRFLTDRTGCSADGVRRVLDHLTPATFGEEWDLEAQAEHAGMSFEAYALAMNPILQMSMEQAQARLREVEAQLARGEAPKLSADEREKVRKWEAIVEKIASLSGQRLDVVVTIIFTASVLKNRQHEILQELARLKALGEGPDGSHLHN
jgi:hypothetical protein